MTESRTVDCVKLGQTLPGLEKPPFPGELGRLIYERVSKQAWQMWREDMQMKVLNEYRLNMSDAKDHKVMMEQMRRFLNLDEGESLEVENADRGRAGNDGSPK